MIKDVMFIKKSYDKAAIRVTVIWYILFYYELVECGFVCELNYGFVSDDNNFLSIVFKFCF